MMQGYRCFGGPYDGKTVVVDAASQIVWGVARLDSVALVPNDKVLTWSDIDKAAGVYHKVRRTPRGGKPETFLVWQSGSFTTPATSTEGHEDIRSDGSGALPGV